MDVDPGDKPVSDELEEWLDGENPKTLGSLIDVFGERSFAIIFVLLMALPALPIPTGGATHVLEVVTMLLALELIAGRRSIWLPERFKRMQLGGGSREKFVTKLLGLIRRLERFSRPRGARLFDYRLSGVLFGVVLGTLLSVVSATSAALVAFLIGRRLGRDQVEQIAGRRLGKLDAWISRNVVGCSARSGRAICSR